MAGERKADYQKWRENEFRSDIRVLSMTPIQRWMYRTLCQSAWVESTRPYLPVEDESLWRLSGCETLEQWIANKTPVLEMFVSVEVDGAPRLSQKRITEDWDFLQGYRGEQMERGRRGNAAQGHLIGDADATQVRPNGDASATLGRKVGSLGKEDKVGKVGGAAALIPASLFFDGQKLKLTALEHDSIKAKFPEFSDAQLRLEYAKMDEWCVRKKTRGDKKNWLRFAFNWINGAEPLNRTAPAPLDKGQKSNYLDRFLDRNKKGAAK